MTKISLDLIQKLRERTGAGMLDCRKALEETGGDMEKAVDELRKRGAAIAANRSGKVTSEGLVHAYIHTGNKVGVLIELNCETDFVARTEEIQTLAKNLCMQIAAAKPLYLSPEEVDPKFLEREKTILKEQLIDSGKPAKIIDQILEGKITKLYSEVCLLKQSYIKNDQLTIEDLLKEVIARTGENVRIRRFARYEVGA